VVGGGASPLGGAGAYVAGDSAGNAARANTGSGGGGGAQATGDWEMVVALVSMLRL